MTIARAVQSVTASAGPAAHSITTLWWIMFAIALLVVVGVLALTGYALFRRRSPEARDAPARTAPDHDRAATRWIVHGGITFPAIVLTGLFVLSLVTLAALHPDRERASLEIDVVGKQWWWLVRYQDDTSANVFETANEIRIPAARRVGLTLRSDDVIHSFWVPALHGKIDMIPGRTTRMWIQADTPGVYRGQCAEYCGLQHGKMRLTIVALDSAAFERWLVNERAPARAPETHEQREGRDVFMTSACALCHTIRGTPALGSTGPDLTHVASRLTLAAGALPNTQGHLGGWIANPQELKPGALMPRVPIEAHDLHGLIHYLGSLQ